MKNLLLMLIIFNYPLWSSGQIHFEPVSVPKDFNIREVRKSPTGEYFIQAVNKLHSIYQSIDGQVWTQIILGELVAMKEMIFFNDGTPVMQSEYGIYYIRRNGNWNRLSIFGQPSFTSSVFIYQDTLFTYHDNQFGYSLDKGLTYTVQFEPNESIEPGTSHLWKVNDKYILHHTGAEADYLSVFNTAGDRIFFLELNQYTDVLTYNQCGEILLTGFDEYYLFNTNDLSYVSGSIEDITPDGYFGTLIYSHAGIYYTKTDFGIYKTSGCNFDWELIAEDDLLYEHSSFWIDDKSGFILYERLRNYFFERPEGSQEWIQNSPDIDYAFMIAINESKNMDQVALTTNGFYSKKNQENDWSPVAGNQSYESQINYGPDGTLYMSDGTTIVYSNDNGITLQPVPLPNFGTPNPILSMHGIEDGILILVEQLFGRLYYSTDNGLHWNVSNLSSSPSSYLIRLVNDDIFAINMIALRVNRINIHTNEVVGENLGPFIFSDYTNAAIMKDGTIYFKAHHTGNNNRGIFRYRFGEGNEFLGAFEELDSFLPFHGSGPDLYLFNHQEYYVFDGENMATYLYSGLPNALSEFFVADNNHVYAISFNHAVYRSTAPLSYFQTISGAVYHNLDIDCELDTADTTLAFWKVKVQSGNFMRVKNTDQTGHYYFSVPQGDYTISSVPPDENWSLCNDSYQASIDETNPHAELNFVAKSLTDCAALQVDFSTSLLRRCFENYYYIRVRNTGPNSSAGTQLRVELDPFFEFHSASIAYTMVGDSILLFDLEALEVNDEVTFQIIFTLSCDAVLGAEHCLRALLDDTNLCSGGRNSYVECQVNIGSFDPNDKRIFNEEGKETNRIDKGEYIYYHIRFQNTGTDTAFNIEVIDQLSSMLDFNSLEMLSSSHPYTYEITDGPALKVNFDHILLVDSTTNEPASHGYFKFRIKPLAEFDYGTMIPNQADIYFDFNDPVLTNEATLTILPPVRTKEPNSNMEFSIYPNPSDLQISLLIDDLHELETTEYSILDEWGRIIKQAPFEPGSKIEIGHLPAGLYTLVIRKDHVALGVRKFAKH